MITKEEINNWKVNIFNSIRDISDLEQQKLSWTGKHPLLASSFYEIINILYDDFDFEEYLNYLKGKGNNILYSKMLLLNKSLNDYIKTEKTDGGGISRS